MNGALAWRSIMRVRVRNADAWPGMLVSEVKVSPMERQRVATAIGMFQSRDLGPVDQQLGRYPDFGVIV